MPYFFTHTAVVSVVDPGNWRKPPTFGKLVTDFTTCNKQICVPYWWKTRGLQEPSKQSQEQSTHCCHQFPAKHWLLTSSLCVKQIEGKHFILLDSTTQTITYLYKSIQSRINWCAICLCSRTNNTTLYFYSPWVEYTGKGLRLMALPVHKFHVAYSESKFTPSTVQVPLIVGQL